MATETNVSAPKRGWATGRGALVLAVVTAAAAALVVTYLALGGGSYKPVEVADPCKPRRPPAAEGFEQVSEQLLLSGLDGAACNLQVTREELALALTSAEARARFMREHKIRRPALERAVRAGLQRAVRDAERAGRLSNAQASLLRGAISALPIATLIEGFRTGEGLVGALGELLGR